MRTLATLLVGLWAWTATAATPSYRGAFIGDGSGLTNLIGAVNPSGNASGLTNIQGTVSVEDYGASDNLDDNSPAIQTAFAYATANQKILRVPKLYKIKSGLRFTNNAWFVQGNGDGQSGFVANGPMATMIVIPDQTGYAQTRMRDIKIDGGGQAAIGIVYGTNTFVSVETLGCTFTNCTYAGALSYAAEISTWTSCHFDGNGVFGFAFFSSPANTVQNTLDQFLSCTFRLNGAAGFYSSQHAECVLRQCDLESNWGPGLWVNATNAATSCNRLLIADGWVENNIRSNSVAFNDQIVFQAGAGQLDDIIIQNEMFFGNIPGTAGHIKMSAGHYYVEHNQFSHPATSCLGTDYPPGFWCKFEQGYGQVAQHAPTVQQMFTNTIPLWVITQGWDNPTKNWQFAQGLQFDTIHSNLLVQSITATNFFGSYTGDGYNLTNLNLVAWKYATPGWVATNGDVECAGNFTPYSALNAGFMESSTNDYYLQNIHVYMGGNGTTTNACLKVFQFPTNYFTPIPYWGGPYELYTTNITLPAYTDNPIDIPVYGSVHITNGGFVMVMPDATNDTALKVQWWQDQQSNTNLPRQALSVVQAGNIHFGDPADLLNTYVGASAGYRLDGYLPAKINGSGLTNIPVAAMTGGFTGDFTVLTNGSDTATFHITNGQIMTITAP